MKNTRLAIIAALAAATVAVPAHADGGLSFSITGDTYDAPFTITNTSTAGERVTGFGVSLISPFGFDTAANGFGGNTGFVPFTPNAATALNTGYTGPTTFADGSTSLAFTFTNFNVGESFIWDIDVDGPNQATVLGRDLIGSTGYADFSNGTRGTGTFQALGSTGAQFVINTFAPIPAVPETATWAMMILGMGAVGYAMRRSNAKFDAKIKRMTAAAA